MKTPTEIFDSIIDADLLATMERTGAIACSTGFRLSSIAQLEVEMEVETSGYPANIWEGVAEEYIHRYRWGYLCVYG